ncbi:high-affinity branched-chain amino acid ABC transporter permease LivM [Novispirillum itersonii]|uniref:high-affinity branched-chain amino acid ABC transporter permease LivM n=1 Tax=Novispirillum itersonii TaxID=189 RepID=UPI00037C1AF3|nr:high-affinity branched-chain amino acid ABC transporter permease LivM [Novispirillum itersonii]
MADMKNAVAAPGQGGFDVGAALKESGKAAFVAGLLGLPLLALKADNFGSKLGLVYRWDALFIAIAAVFVGRFLMILLSGRQKKSEGGVFAAFGKGIHNNMALIGLAGLAIGVLLPVVYPDRYVIYIATTFMIYVMLGWGLNIVVGLAGLLDLGYVAFYAVGAYSYAMIATQFGWSFWVVLPLAGVFAAFFGVILGFPVLRLRGDYLAIVTLGFGEIIRVILINWTDFTGGPNGISGIPPITFFGLPFKNGDHGTFASFFGIDHSPVQRIIFLYFVILVLATLTNLFTQRMRKLPVGRAWEALREDEIACRSLGINPTNIKLSAFALGAMFGGFAGSFFSVRAGFVSPESFTFIESAVILAIVVLGGMGSQLGVVIAAFFVVILPEVFREFEEYRMLLFGLAMMVIMVWRPNGLLSFREPTIRLHPKKESA